MEPVQTATDLNVALASHEGMTGKRNEDSLGAFTWKLDERRTLHVGVVADGVGGQIAGEVASREAVAAVQRYFDRQSRVSNISGHLEQAILAANEAVYEASKENPAHRGMSTTIALAAMSDNRLYTAHVGDSRIYLLRDGRLRQISTDHTWAQEAIEAGLLTREQAKTHPNRNVIRRHLGGSLQIEVDHRLVLETGQSSEAALANQGHAVRPGDTVLICSDGLTDMISDQAVRASLTGHFYDLDTAARELIDKANQAGGKDNITVVIMQVPPTGAPVAASTDPAIAITPKEPTLMVEPAAAAPSVPATKGGRRWGLPLLLAGGFAALVVVAVIVAGAFLFGRSNGDEDTPVPTSEFSATPAAAEATASLGPPATAAILATAGTVTATPLGATPENTPELIPTLRDTATSTRRPGSPRTATPTPGTPTPGTPTSAASATSGPPPPPPPPGTTATNTPQPTNTQQPPTPSNTPPPPPPPTNTNTPKPPPTPTNTPPGPPPTATNTPVIGQE